MFKLSDLLPLLFNKSFIFVQGKPLPLYQLQLHVLGASIGVRGVVVGSRLSCAIQVVVTADALLSDCYKCFIALVVASLRC